MENKQDLPEPEFDLSTLLLLANEQTELSYSQLCDKLKVPKFGGKQKISQLSRLESYCKFTQLPNKKYLIAEAYDESILQFISFLNAPKQQLLFNIAMYKALMVNGSGLMFCSNTEILQKLSEVNDNFRYTFSLDNMEALGEDFMYMTNMTKTVYNILMQWTRRRIDNMGFAVISTTAFRLYKLTPTKTGLYIHTDNIGFGTPYYSRCQRIIDKAISEVVKDDKYLIYDEKTHERLGLKWMPEGLWTSLENKIDRYTREEFKAEGYNKLRIIKAFSPASGDTIQRKMELACQRVKELDAINQEAQRKIIATSQLDGKFTDDQRKHYIEYNISDSPPILFKQELAKIRKAKEDKW